MSDRQQTIEPSVVFPLDDNTFIFNGKARPPIKLASTREDQVPPAEEVRPNNLPEDQRGRHAHRLWRGVGLWVFITLAAVVAIPVGAGSLMLATRVKPTVTFPALATAIAPIALAAPSPNVIDELHRFADAVSLPAAYPRHHDVARHAERIIPRHVVASKPEEPPSAPIGCPPSVCFPWNR